MKKKLLTGLLLVILLTILTVIFSLRSFAADEARKFLEEKGVPVQSLTLTSLTPNSIVLHDVILGENQDFQAQQLTLTRLSGTSLETARVRVQADGIHINARHDGKSWYMGGVENLWQPPGQSAPQNAKMAEFLLENGHIDMEGSLKADVKGTLNAQAFHYKTAALSAFLTGIQLQPKMTNQSQLSVPFSIAKAEVKNADGLLIAPLKVTGDIQHILGSDALNGTVKATDLQQKIALNGTIKHALKASSGTIDFNTNIVHFSETEKGLKLSELLPVIAQNLPTPSLFFQTKGIMHYAGNGLQTLDGNVAFHQLEAHQLLAKALPHYGTLQGALKGTIPFHVTPTGWEIKQATIQNEGPMQLAAVEEDKSEKIQELANGIAGLFGKKVNVSAFNGVNISSLLLQLNSLNEKGDMAIKGALNGHNPLLKRPANLKVDFTTNLSELIGNAAKKNL